MPVATVGPTRSASDSIEMPESASACRAAATIRCAKRSMRRACLRSMYSVGSKPVASQAKWTAKSVESNCVISPAPERPATSASQVDSTSTPSGVTAPRPVITTLRLPFMLPFEFICSHPETAVDEQHLARDERGLVGAEEGYQI